MAFMHTITHSALIYVEHASYYYRTIVYKPYFMTYVCTLNMSNALIVLSTWAVFIMSRHYEIFKTVYLLDTPRWAKILKKGLFRVLRRTVCTVKMKVF